MFLLNVTCVVYLNDWLRARENKISETKIKSGMIDIRENWNAEGKHFSGR
jgi:hypothetical protein